MKNPYRYRGYRYDTETGLYYLNSRYYNPEWGRFLNIDAIGGNIGALLSHNIFAYCSNNPITAKDPSGFRPEPAYGEETEATRKASYKAMSKEKNEKLGPTGEKNSHGKEYDEDGKLVKERWYGQDGKAARDRHHTNHGNPKKHPKVPHKHDWGWKDGVVGGKWELGPWYSEVLRPAIGVATVLVTGVAIIWVVGNDDTGIGVADDWSIAPLGGAFGKGLIMILGG